MFRDMQKRPLARFSTKTTFIQTPLKAFPSNTIHKVDIRMVLLFLGRKTNLYPVIPQFVFSPENNYANYVISVIPGTK